MQWRRWTAVDDKIVVKLDPGAAAVHLRGTLDAVYKRRRKLKEKEGSRRTGAQTSKSRRPNSSAVNAACLPDREGRQYVIDDSGKRRSTACGPAAEEDADQSVIVDDGDF